MYLISLIRINAIIALTSLSLCSYSQLRINEVLSSNIANNLDDLTNYNDWIEIYNDGASVINLQGYYISNEKENPAKFRVNKTIYIGPKNYRVIWADELNVTGSSIHTNFNLDIDGDFIGIFSPQLEIVDTVTLPQQIPDVSYGRNILNPNDWGFYVNPTCGTGNNTAILEEYTRADSVSFSLPSGFYDRTLTIELSVPEGGQIKYTTNGDYPKPNSLTYTEPIQITQSTVIRARCYSNGKFPGKVFSNTYFITEPKHNIPVVSLSTDEENFNDDYYGIYVEGKNGITGRCVDIPVNWNREWERPLNFEFFDTSGVKQINQLVGTKLYGGCSRANNLKSLALISRKDYEQSGMYYEFFADKAQSYYKSLVLRNSGNDFNNSMLRDGLIHTIVKNSMDIDYQAYNPVIVYLNGEYFGLLNLREKVNENYVESNYEINSNYVNFVENDKKVVNGNVGNYATVIDFVENNSLNSEENYRYVADRIDVNEYLNYYLTNIFFANNDWPQNNVKYWQNNQTQGKWRWVLYDTDRGFGLYSNTGNILNWATRNDWSTELFTSLLEYDTFKYEFIQRMATHMNTTFDAERMINILDSLKNIIAPYIQKQNDLWGGPYNWETNINVTMKNWARSQKAIVSNWFISKYAISGFHNITVSTNSDMGDIMVAGAKIPKLYSGRYFNGIPIRFEAMPNPGYKFLRWEGASNSNDKEITITTQEGDNLTAFFGLCDTINDLIINEISSKNINGILDGYNELEDWIELYNNSSQSIDLRDLYITDSIDYPSKQRLFSNDNESNLIEPGEYKLLIADKERWQGNDHLNFKLSNDGKTLAIFQKIGENFVLVDSLTYMKQYEGVTYGKISCNSIFCQYLYPTPGMANSLLPLLTNIFINECMASNTTFIADEYGEYDDWIEIYNNNDFPVDIAGLFITDSLGDPMKDRISAVSPDSTTIPGKGFLVLWADNQPEQGIRHLNFKLDASGEQIGLFQKDGVSLIDNITYLKAYADGSAGRYPDASENFQFLDPSPGISNKYNALANIFINEFMPSNTSTITDEYGEFDDWIEIYNNNDFPVDIGGLFITDSLGDPMKDRISAAMPDSTTIPEKGFLVLWADNQPEQGIYHLNFKLRADGEQIGISQINGVEFIDSLIFNKMSADVASGRLNDGSSNIQYLSPTPGSANYLNCLSGLAISEVSAGKNTYYQDEYGEYDDWIELFNNNDFPVNIGGLYITDSLENSMKDRISNAMPDSTTIPGKGFLILWADNQPEQGLYHLNFKLSADGEQIAIYCADAVSIIDSVSFPEQFANYTYSVDRESDNWQYMRPTPLQNNINSKVDGIFINEFMADNNQYPDDYGNFSDWIEIYNNNNFSVDIGGYYLSDSLPDRTKYRIPSNQPEITTISGNDFLVFYADNDSKLGPLHTNFKLSRSGEQLGLFAFDGKTVLDSFTFYNQYKNSSFGKIQEKGKMYSIKATPNASDIMPDFSSIFINELVVDNEHKYADPFGEFDDWIELYNASNEPVDIGGLYISDELDYPQKNRISSEYPDITTIPANGYLILWADNNPAQGNLHLNFKLSKEGESIGLYSYNYSLIDSVTYPENIKARSYGRTGYDGTNWSISEIQTPNSSNLTTDMQEFSSNYESVFVYPNPMTDYLVFDISLYQSSSLLVKIYNTQGILVDIISHDASKNHIILKWEDRKKLDLDPGLYYYIIETQNEVFSGKIILQ